jgi:redox-sensitive bicupin YhaK (pirin superfamily)
MITIRRAGERGHGEFGWLDTWHTFSFGHYFDPKQLGYSDLRVINEDRVQPGEGFPTHSHRDMEILTYVLEGALAHQDSTGSGGVLRYGDVQRMSAGAGVTHSELNGSREAPVHFLQIWILPETKALPPSYEQRHFAPEDKRGRLRVIAARDARQGALAIHQDATVYAALLDEGQAVTHRFAGTRKGWVQVARGKVRVNDRLLEAGDGAAIADEEGVTVVAAAAGSELLLFDLAA